MDRRRALCVSDDGRYTTRNDRLGEDLRVVEREIARGALANPKATRTVPGMDPVAVAVGLPAVIGPVARLADPDKLVAYLGPNPNVHGIARHRGHHIAATVSPRKLPVIVRHVPWRGAAYLCSPGL